MFISAYNVPMLESLVSVCPQRGPTCTQINTPGMQGSQIYWFNKTSLNLDFKVNPGGCLFTSTTCPPTPNAANNNFQPAPVAGETYGVTGATTIADLGGVPAADTTSVQQWDFSSNPVNLNEGVTVLHWEAIDNVGILEQNIQLSSVPTTSPCPDGSPNLAGVCYTTNLFSAQIGVDSIPPTITPTLSPAPTTNNGVPNSYLINQLVTATYACTDLPSASASGVASCAPGSTLDTSTVGTHSFSVTATDVAGNTGSATVSYTVVIPALTMVPPSVSFGTVTLWGGSKQVLIVTNNTTTPQ